MLQSTAGCVLTCVTVLAKSSNVTEFYIEKHRKMIEDKHSRLKLNQHYTVEICELYSRQIGFDRLTTDHLYRILMMVNTVFKESETTLIAWMIAQAAAHNVAGAVFFAEAVRKLNYIDLPILTGRIPDGQWRHYIRLCLLCFHDRFGSILLVLQDVRFGYSKSKYTKATWIPPQIGPSGSRSCCWKYSVMKPKLKVSQTKKRHGEIKEIPPILHFPR